MIREACEKDIDRIEELEQLIFSDPWSVNSLTQSMGQAHVHIWVAIDEIEIIKGYLIFYTAGGDGDLARVAVDPLYRRGGVAEQLMEEMWNYCNTYGFDRVLLEVRESNIGARKLYEKHGFLTLGVRKGYYSKPHEDGIIMEKQLDIPTGI